MLQPCGRAVEHAGGRGCKQLSWPIHDPSVPASTNRIIRKKSLLLQQSVAIKVLQSEPAHVTDRDVFPPTNILDHWILPLSRGRKKKEWLVVSQTSSRIFHLCLQRPWLKGKCSLVLVSLDSVAASAPWRPRSSVDREDEEEEVEKALALEREVASSERRSKEGSSSYLCYSSSFGRKDRGRKEEMEAKRRGNQHLARRWQQKKRVSVAPSVVQRVPRDGTTHVLCLHNFILWGPVSD